MVLINELLDDQQLFEMSVKQKKAEQIVTGLEQPINLHLLKLLGCQAEETTRLHWKHELHTWLFRIASLSLKPDNKPIPANLVYKWLYDEPFGGVELQNVNATLRFLTLSKQNAYQRNDVATDVISQKLQQIHLQLADSLSKHDRGEAIIDGL